MRLGSVFCVVAGGLVLAGCSSPPPVSRPPVPSFSAASTSSVAAITAVPRGCDEVAEEADVDQIAGHQLPGSMAPVVGVPMPSINRTARLDCYYGIPPGQPPAAAAVSIGIASYSDAASAQHRAALTVTDARNSGAQASDVRVAGQQAVLLAGPQDQELVLAHGELTVLVSARAGVLPAGKTGPPLIALAQRALTAH
ncbi:MAG TPA: hypothetical protein VG756_05320 [Pseudonocardiaceae bacterium]|jgi:hypothetical protein|nr:hypothetical protein [Pseudonocardiaceae bacterium]